MCYAIQDRITHSYTNVGFLVEHHHSLSVNDKEKSLLDFCKQQEKLTFKKLYYPSSADLVTSAIIMLLFSQATATRTSFLVVISYKRLE